MIHNGLCAKLDSHQCPDQAGFRKYPDDASSYDAQACCPKQQRMENGHVGGGDRLPETVRFHAALCNLEMSHKPFCQ